jgi:predicted double-glycine peptidase
VVFLGGLAIPAAAGTVPVRFFSEPIWPKKVESFKERRLRQVVRQTEDFSCGAAALATILHYYYGQELNERDAIFGMFKAGDKEKIRQSGFSMLDMKKLSEQLNYRAQGYKILDINKLKSLKVPVITLIDTNRYKHFVVIRKVTDEYVFLSDPSWGNRRMSLSNFERVWNQVILAINGPLAEDAEGLYAGDYRFLLPKDDVTRTRGILGYRAALDPSFALIYQSKFQAGRFSDVFWGPLTR